MKTEDYLPQNDEPYSVHYGDYLVSELEEDIPWDENTPCLPSNEIDERTIKTRHFKTEIEAKEYVTEFLDRRKRNEDLRWLAFVYIQKSQFTVVKDYTEWLAMS